ALDPLSPIVNVNYAVLLHFANRDDEAMQQFQRCLERDNEFLTLHLKLSRFYADRRQWLEAGNEVRKFAPNLHFPAASATPQGYAQLYSVVINDIKKHGSAPETWSAMMHATLGDRDKTIASLKKAADDHDGEFIIDIRAPALDFVRTDPRYIDLMHSIGLQP
ncbi:MAG TPA: hypothetical protein VF786_11640, partial [Terriglobales bacterium]